VITISFSELEAFYACPLRWRLQYKERWNTDKPRVYLDRGTVWHAMLQTHYELGRQGQPLTARFLPVMQTLYSGGLPDAENDLLEWMYDGYVACYGTDDEHKVLATEINRTIPLPDPADPSRPGPYGLKVKIDQVTRDRRGRIWVWDHKTGGDFTPVDRLEWRPQFPLYAWTMRAARLDVWGFVVNHARTKRNKSEMTFDQRYRRNFLVYSDRQLTAIAVEAAKAAAAMHDPDRVEYAAMRDLAMGGCTSCDFELAHRAQLRGGDIESTLVDLGFRKGYEGAA
jgi:hypothetical protein